MTERQEDGLPTMSGPATYRIDVRGKLDPSFSCRLGGMSVVQAPWPSGEIHTVLLGRLADQAMFAGVLEALYELHLPVVSVRCVEADETD